MGPGTPPLDYETGYNFKQRRKKIQKSISWYIEGYNVCKKSARQHYSACAKHCAGLKTMKPMKFTFRTPINTENSRSYVY